MNILLIVSSYNQKLSGGKVARYLSYLLKQKGHKIFILLRGASDDDLKDLSNAEKVFDYNRQYNRRNLFFYYKGLKKYYQNVILNNEISVVHICPQNVPALFIKSAHKLGVKVISQVYMHDFYCARTYNNLNGKVCVKCSGGNFLHAVANNCYTVTKRSVIKNLYKVLYYSLFRKVFLQSNAFLSPSKNFTKLLSYYGADKRKVYEIPLFFDGRGIKRHTAGDLGEYFIFFSQKKAVKGFYLLLEVAAKAKHHKFLFVLPNNVQIGNEIKKVNENCEFRSDITWGTGLEEAILKSKAVMLPSLWDAPPEYTLLESLGYSKPVIAFKVGIHDQIITHGINSLLLNINDVDGFVKILDEFDDKSYVEFLSKGARKLFEDLTDESQYLDKLDWMYKNLNITAGNYH